MFHMPMSSPMITTMLGRCCWAAAGMLAAIPAANDTKTPRQTVLIMLMLMVTPQYNEWQYAPSRKSCAMQIAQMRRTGQLRKQEKIHTETGSLYYCTIFVISELRSLALGCLLHDNGAPLSLIHKDKFGKHQFSGRACVPVGVHGARLDEERIAALLRDRLLSIVLHDHSSFQDVKNDLARVVMLEAPRAGRIGHAGHDCDLPRSSRHRRPGKHFRRDSRYFNLWPRQLGRCRLLLPARASTPHRR